MHRKRAHTRVRGRVQGVSYRAATRATAESLGVVGWVRNLPDGSVELEAEGEGAAIDQLIAWLHRGPIGASVSSVDVAWLTPRNDETCFEIRF